MYGFFVHRNEKRWRLSRGDHCREVVVSTFLKAFHHRENESAAHVLFIEDEFVLSFFLTWQSLES